MRPPSPRGDPLRAALWWVAVCTVLSGAVLVVAGGPVLDLLDADRTRLATHFFAIVGMFMLVVGAMSVSAYADDAVSTYVLLWSALQKVGAALAVGLAVARDLFGGLALLVAAFDLLTGVLGLLFLVRVRRRPGVDVPAARTPAGGVSA